MNTIAAVGSAIVLLSASPLLVAQPVYKCGNTFSQTPCAPDATAKQVAAPAAPEPAPGVRGYDLCAAAAPRAVGSPEPETAQVQSAGARTMEVIRYAGQPISAHRYDLLVDAKTIYGVRSGPVQLSCWVSEDQARILQLGRR